MFWHENVHFSDRCGSGGSLFLSIYFEFENAFCAKFYTLLLATNSQNVFKYVSGLLEYRIHLFLCYKDSRYINVIYAQKADVPVSPRKICKLNDELFLF